MASSFSYAQLERAIAECDPVTYVGEAFRHTAPNRDPLSGRGARLSGGRWNPPSSFPTLYLADRETTALAEMRRLASRYGLSITDLLPRQLWQVDLTLSRLLDLRQGAASNALAVSHHDLITDELSLTQTVGRLAHNAELEGVISTSAADQTGTVITLFLDRLAERSSITPVKSRLVDHI